MLRAGRRTRQRIRRTFFGLLIFFFAVLVCLYSAASVEDRAKQWHEVERRILSQIVFKPEKPSEQPVKIYVASSSNYVYVRPGFDEFRSPKCVMHNCFITRNDDDFLDADVVLLNAWSKLPNGSDPDRSSQLWVLYQLESPAHTPSLERFNGK
ncbi:hypothetical protein AAVH_31245, partial [Aphelenchoides avenae]